jgi:hypothetical protein
VAAHCFRAVTSGNRVPDFGDTKASEVHRHLSREEFVARCEPRGEHTLIGLPIGASSSLIAARSGSARRSGSRIGVGVRTANTVSRSP